MTNAVYLVPVELVERLATPTGLAFLIQARLRGAVLLPHAEVRVRNSRFVAEAFFETPIGPERQDSLAFMLGVAPEMRR